MGYERTGKCSSEWVLYEDRINSIDFNSENPNRMTISSSDGTACNWDLRIDNANKSKTLTTISHKRALHSSYFSPSGRSLVTTRYLVHSLFPTNDFSRNGRCKI